MDGLTRNVSLHYQFKLTVNKLPKSDRSSLAKVHQFRNYKMGPSAVPEHHSATGFQQNSFNKSTLQSEQG